jgi:glycosyltransferase involved in cell wall biosynthesis
MTKRLSPHSTRRPIVAIVPCREPLTGGVQADLKILEELRVRGWDIATVHMEEAPGKVPRYRVLDQIQFNLRLIRRFWNSAPGFIVLEDQGLSGAVAVFNLFARTRMRAPIVVVTYHLVFNLWRHPLRRFVRRVIEGTVARSADLVIASSRSTQEELEDLGVATRNIRLISLGLTRRAQRERRVDHPQAASSVRLLTIGTVEPRKGLKYLIEALGQLRTLPWTLDVVGGLQEPYQTRLTNLACSLHINERIRFHGRRNDEDVADLLAAADIYASPSLGEGFGLAVLEAMERGLPVVATEAGALSELIENERTGLLVPPRDPAALAAALRRTMVDPELRKRLGQSAREAVQGRFSWEETGRQVESVLMGLCDDHRL